MDIKRAIDDLNIKKHYIKSKIPYAPNSQERVELGNRIEVTIDRAIQDLSTIYRLGYQLDPGLTPVPEMKGTPAMHSYESMERHIQRCETNVEEARKFLQQKKKKS